MTGCARNSKLIPLNFFVKGVRGFYMEILLLAPNPHATHYTNKCSGISLCNLLCAQFGNLGVRERVVSKRAVLADVPLYQSFLIFLDPKTRTGVHSPKPPLTKPTSCLLSRNYLCSRIYHRIKSPHARDLNLSL